MPETRSRVETGLRWFTELVSTCQESAEAGKADMSRRLGGSRIKHSTLSVGKPCTWGRTWQKYEACKGNSSPT